MSLVLFMLGAVAWTAVEYGLHRFQGHGGRGARLRRFRAQHLEHHLDPSTFAPWIEVVIGGLISWALATALGMLLVGWSGLFYGAGYLAGYAAYEGLHRLVHSSLALPFPLDRVRMHHLAHHDHPRGRFGITSTLWDRVWGTA